jgi:hypothetical protein
MMNEADHISTNLPTSRCLTGCLEDLLNPVEVEKSTGIIEIEGNMMPINQAS